MQFRRFQWWVERLREFDLEKDLSVWEIVRLIEEVKVWVDTPLQADPEDNEIGLLSDRDRSRWKKRVSISRDENHTGTGGAVAGDSAGPGDRSNMARRRSV